MSYSFGKASRARLEDLDSDLVSVLEEAIQIVDFTILETHRGEEAQNRFVAQGKSKLSFPNSKHNSMPSMAVDLAPYPIDWEDGERFTHLAGVIRGIAHARGVKLRWGGDWDRDGELSDNRFNDLPHIEKD